MPEKGPELSPIVKFGLVMFYSVTGLLVLLAIGALLSDPVEVPDVAAVGTEPEAKAEAPADFCAAWTPASQDSRAAIILRSIELIGSEQFDQACLILETPALVRWANRLCGGQDSGFLMRDFAILFRREAEQRCP